MTYKAKPREKLKVEIEAPGFETLVVIQIAPPVRAKTTLKYGLIPSHFPYGRWLGETQNQKIQLDLQKSKAGSIDASFIILQNTKESKKTKLRGDYNPVRRKLSLFNLASKGSIGKLIISFPTDFENMIAECYDRSNTIAMSFNAHLRTTTQ